MIPYLEKTLNVRRDELAPASLLFLYLFLTIGCYIMGQTAGVGMFLKVFPNYLPHAMVGTALLVGLFASVYIRLAHRVRLQALIIGSVLFFSLCFLLFWGLTRFQSRWVYLLIYMWVYLAGAMGPTMGWTLANCALTTREARRLFGFIGAGAVLGAPCAAFITADVVGHHRLLPETLLLVMAATQGLAALSVWLLCRQTGPRMGALGLAPAADAGIPRDLGQVWAFIRDSRFLLLITGLIFVSCMATMIITYQFQIVAKATYGADTAGLITFFARFNGYIGVAAFVLQMLLTGHLLRSFGIRVTLFILPVVFIGGSMALLLAPVLLTACILKGSHQLLRYSLDKSSTELLYLPVAPPDIKSQIKSFIDGFIWRAADGVAGLVLWLFATVLKFSPGRISLVNLVVLAGWIAVAYGVRREYLNVLRRAVERRTLDPERVAAGILDSTTTGILAGALARGGEQQVLYGLSLFEMGREPGWHPLLRDLLAHPSPAVRQRALRLLSDAGDRKIQPQVETMLADESLEVRTEALHYLVVHARLDPLNAEAIKTELPSYVVQGAVVAYLARTGDPGDFSAAQLILQAMLSAPGPDPARARRDAARVLGLVPPPSELHAELFTLLRDENPEVVEQALLSAGKIQGREFLPQVVDKLGQRRLRGAARAALTQYGQRAVGTLQDYLNDDTVPMSVRGAIPAVLAGIATPGAAATLGNSFIQSDPALRFAVLKALNKLRSRNPALLPTGIDFADMLNSELIGYYRSFQILAAFDPEAWALLRPRGTESLLSRALRERMDYEFERIFRLLALLYPMRDVYNACAGITSGRPQLQANALELLEHLLPPELYRRLSYGLDPEISLEEKLSYAERLCRVGVRSRSEALRVLLHSKDRWLCACALYTAGDEGLTELNEDVRRVPHEIDPLLDETWRWASTRLAAGPDA
jgi:AAA family ATP:ADP antiporter